MKKEIFALQVPSVYFRLFMGFFTSKKLSSKGEYHEDELSKQMYLEKRQQKKPYE